MPARAADLAGGELRAVVSLRLPHGEGGAGRVLQHRHTADIHDIERVLDHRASQTLGLGGCFHGTLHGDVQQPVRRHALHLLAHPVQASHVLVSDTEHGVNASAGNGVVLGLPAHEPGVEALGALRVGGGQLDPAKRARSVRHLVHAALPCSI